MASLVHRPLLTWAATSSLVLAGLVAGIAGAAHSTASASTACPGVVQPTVPGRTPVLFVHGINSDAGVWTTGTVSGTTDAPLQYVTGMLGAQVAGYAFDWSSYSGAHAGSTLAWVTGPPTPGPGQLLAKAISCLAAGTGHKVIVIAHSMGGLVTEDASKIDKTAEDIAAVFTLDTPFKGSWLASSAIGQKPAPALQIPAQAISTFCTLSSGQAAKQHTKQPGVIDKDAAPVCQLISERDNPGMVGMREEKTTAQDGWWSLNWPGNFPVIRLASDIQGTWQAAWPIGSQISIADVGDGVVSVASQLYGGDGTEPTVTCQIALDGPLGPAGFVPELAASPCFHTKAPYNKTLLDAIIRAIGQRNLVPTASPVPIDWNNQSYDLTCDNIVQNPVKVTFRNGRATVQGPGIGSSYSRWDVSVSHVAHGTLPSLGAVTAVLFTCSPYPSNFSVQELRVYRTADGSEIGRIPDLPTGGGVLPGVFEPATVAVASGRVSAGVMFYAPGDSHASGPTAPGHVTWRWNGQEFTTDTVEGIPAACPTSAQLMTAWNAAPSAVRQSWAGAPVTSFSGISCWDGWVVAIPQSSFLGNGEFVFSQAGNLHLITIDQLQQEFRPAVCASPYAPPGWKSPPLISCESP